MIEKIRKDLKTIFKDDPNRLAHIEGVEKTALYFQKKFDLDRDKIITACLLHDITKNKPREYHETIIKDAYGTAIFNTYTPPLYHAFSAAFVAKEEYGVTDKDVLSAIENHTVGKPAMTLFEKVIFISDYIEPTRPYKASKQVRKLAFQDIDLAVFTAIDKSIRLFESEEGSVPEIAYQAREYYKKELLDLVILFETERTFIRRTRMKDASVLAKWWNDGRLMASVGFPYGLGIPLEKVEKQLETMSQNEDATRIVLICDKETKHAIGELSYGHHDKRHKTMRIGMKIAEPDYQKKGYGEETLRGFVEYLFETYGLEAILIDTFCENHPARKLYEKLGAKTLSVEKDYWTNKEGKSYDVIFYSLDKKTYKKGGNNG